MIISLGAAKGRIEKAMKKLVKDVFPTFNLNLLADQKRLIYDILKLNPEVGKGKFKIGCCGILAKNLNFDQKSNFGSKPLSTDRIFDQNCLL